jgi:hypothetical protein
VSGLVVDENLKAQVKNFENTIKNEVESGNAECAMDQTSLRHFFVPAIEDGGSNLYTRELTIPKGMSFTGMLHRHQHMVFLMKGELLVVSEQGKKTHKSTLYMGCPFWSKTSFLCTKRFNFNQCSFDKSYRRKPIRTNRRGSYSTHIQRYGIT